MKHSLWVAVAFGVLTSGCAGMGYVLDNYKGVRVDEIDMPDDRYRVFDRPAESRMMITPSVGASMGSGAVSGVTLGGADDVAPKPLFLAAALRYLKEAGRGDCRVVDFYLLVKPQFEIKYECPRPAVAGYVRPPPAPTPLPEPQATFR